MSWDSELREEIILISPELKFYYGLWKNNERSFDKKIGQFNPPNIKGTYVQDLNVKSTVYPLNIFFDGPFHHIIADQFYDSLRDETGQWEIVHPTKGSLILQPISVREIIAPVDVGNYTEFDTQWIEPANIERLIIPDLAFLTAIQTILTAIADAAIILQQLRSDIYSAIQSTVNTLNKISGFVNSVGAAFSETSAIASDALSSANASFQNAISGYGVGDSDTTDLADSMTNIILAPTSDTEDFSSGLQIIDSYIDQFQTLQPTTITVEDYNAVLSQEFGITISLIAMAQLVVDSAFNTRNEIISAIENMQTIFNNAIQNLEETQSNFESNNIDLQYFSQTNTYTTLVNLYTLLYQYLLSQFFDLKIEKRFTLKKARSPLEITVTEYKTLGENEENYDLFLKSNMLEGNEILLLPAGKEVVIYV